MTPTGFGKKTAPVLIPRTEGYKGQCHALGAVGLVKEIFSVFWVVLRNGGFGAILWAGVGLPKMGFASMRIFATMASLMVAVPLIVRTLGAGRRNREAVISFVILSVYYVHLTFWYSGNRLGELGLVMMAAIIAGLLYLNLPRPGRGLLRDALAAGWITGQAMAAGALLSGQVQLASALLLVLALTWPLVGRMRRVDMLGWVLCFALPLAMLACFRVGHGLAVPLIGLFATGQVVLLWRLKRRRNSR